MLFLLSVQNLFQFGAKEGKREGYYGEKIIMTFSLTLSFFNEDALTISCSDGCMGG